VVISRYIFCNARKLDGAGVLSVLQMVNDCKEHLACKKEFCKLLTEDKNGSVTDKRKTFTNKLTFSWKRTLKRCDNGITNK